MSDPEPKAANPQTSALRAAEVSPGQRTLEEILERLPTAPGVYLMRDRRGKIIYIGKAANLRTRVRQYFQPNTGDIRDFVPLLEGIVGEIETTVTSNEKEALLLENNLIKKHQPRFNVKLRDDKNYLVLRLDPEASWPRLEVVRRIGKDGAYYFGPYHSASSCREALRVVNRHFQLRTCTDHVLANRRRPCLQYQIKRCPGPCVLPVSRDEYGEQVRDVRLFLDGKNDELLERLNARMKEAASRTEFERAAVVRDQIRALDATLQAQRVVSTDFIDQDVIGFHREGIALEIVVIAIRQGKMAGSRAFSFTDQEFPGAEILSSFIGLYYDMQPVAPDELLLPFPIADAELKAEWLSEKRVAMGGRRKRVEVVVPQRGTRRELVELAQKNAAASFTSRRNTREDAEATLAKLQKRLRLPNLPRLIECYDISHVQGSETVASMVVFVDGKPEKSRYRTYKLQRGGVGSPDDFASMYEVLSRRFRRAREATAEAESRGEVDDSNWALPDLIVVDGGKGQLGMALAAARDVGIDVRPGVGLPIVALAKERDFEGAASGEPGTPTEIQTTAEIPPAEPAPAGEPAPASELPPPETAAATIEAPPPVEDAPPRRRRGGRKAQPEGSERRPDRVFLAQAKDAIPIRPNSAEMFVLAHLRDEAHRFAVTFHRNQRRRRTLRSVLSDIAGVGAGRQRELLRHFGSVRKIREASVEDLARVPGVSRKTAEAVRAYFDAHRELAAAPPPPATAPDEPPNPAAYPEAEEAEEDALESAFAEAEVEEP
jgi:excinuclease ABC subunit C